MPKRLALVGDHVCEWLDYEDPPLKGDQVRFRTEYASGKYGTFAGVLDNSTFAGQRFDQTMRLFVPDESSQPKPGSPERPLGFGTAATGTVIGVGPDVKGFAPGDRVLALSWGGDIRETNTAPEIHLWPLGDLDPVLALCAEPAYVAFHCVREGNLRYGDTAAVIGLGALGLIAVRMARDSGAERVIAVDPSPGRRALAAKLGATDVVDAKDGDAAKAIHDLCGGPGVDVAIELSGVYAGLATAICAARVGGTVVSAGFYRGEATGGLWLGREWHHNRLTIVVPHGCGWGHPPRDYPRFDARRAYDAIVSLMRQGRLQLPGLISPVVGPAEAPDLFRLSRDEPDKVVKFAVKFPSP